MNITDPRNPATYDRLIEAEEKILDGLAGEAVAARQRIEQLKSMRQLAEQFISTPVPQLIIGERSASRSRRRSVDPENQIIITLYLRDRGMSNADIGRLKASFGSKLKYALKQEGRLSELEYEDGIEGNDFDGNKQTLRRVVWRERHRELIDRVFEANYSHLV